MLLFSKSSIMEDARVPIGFCLAYLAFVFMVRPALVKAEEEAKAREASQDAAEAEKSRVKASKMTTLTWFVLLHNIGLAAYSLVTFVYASRIVWENYAGRDLWDGYCDTDNFMWNDMGFGFWTYWFYISKYYEVLDTIILILKRKPPSFLQVFHHAGAIMTMWGLTVTKCPMAVPFVLFNSFIHTVMYVYFALTTVGYRPSWNKILTGMQIAQFVIGNSYGYPVIFLGEACQTRLQMTATFLGQGYVCALVFLFSAFARKKYGKSKKGVTPGTPIAAETAVSSPLPDASHIKAE